MGAFLAICLTERGCITMHSSQSNRHKIWLLLNGLIFLASASVEKLCLSRTEPDLSLHTGPECLANLDIGLHFGPRKRFAQSFLMGASVPVAVLSAQGLVWIASFEFQRSYWSAMSNVRKNMASSLVSRRGISEWLQSNIQMCRTPGDFTDLRWNFYHCPIQNVMQNGWSGSVASSHQFVLYSGYF